MCTLVLARLCPVDASHTNRPSIRVAVQGPVDSRGALIIISYLGSLFLLSTTKNVPTAMVKQNEYSGGPWKQSAVYASRYREGSSPIATVGKASSAQWTDLCTDIAQSAVCADPVSAAMDTDGRPGAVRPRLKPKHKPVRARCRRLKIGSWDFVPAYEPIECKLLFSRKKLVWEWKADPNTKRKIEIGFTTIDNLYGDYLGSNVSRFVVTVKSLPVLYYGTVTANTPIKWAQSPDFTGGQIKTSSMHELDLSMDQAGLAVFLQSICDYSDSFGEMVRRRRSRDEAVLGLDGPAAEPALKRARVGSFVASPTIPTVSGTSPTKAVISSTATPAPVMSGCSCSGPCDPLSCTCVQLLQACNANICMCGRLCRSPLTCLSEKGVSLNRLRSHRCLADNLAMGQERKPMQQLFGRIRLPCCKSETIVINALAVGMRCFCGIVWDYSFCRRTLVQTGRPNVIFHCPKCRTCQSGDSRHCDTCGVCSSPGHPCPCSKRSAVASVTQQQSKTEANFVASILDDGDDVRMSTPTELSPGDSPAPSAISSTTSPQDTAATGTSLSDLSHWSLAMLGLGVKPRFYEDLQALIAELYR